jgi:hypothetical protein
MKKMLAALAVTATLFAAVPAQATGTIVWENHKARVTEVLSPYEVCGTESCTTYTNAEWTFSSKLAWGVRLDVMCYFDMLKSTGVTVRKGFGAWVKKGHPLIYNTIAPTGHHFTGFNLLVSTSNWSCTAKRI